MEANNLPSYYNPIKNDPNNELTYLITSCIYFYF